MPERVSYVEFVEIDAGTKTKQWLVYSTSGTLLGAVKFFGGWRCFTFRPAADTIFNDGCLTDIAAFCTERTVEWRESLKAAKA